MAGSTLSYGERLSQLLGHYLLGPLWGFRLRLFVVDVPQSQPDVFVALLEIAVAATLISSSLVPAALRWSMLCTLLPIVIYVFSPVPQVVIEYRAYLSVLGVSLAAGWLVSQFTISSLPLFVLSMLLAALTIDRNRVYSSRQLFWEKAIEDCPVPVVILGYKDSRIPGGNSTRDTVIEIAMYRVREKPYAELDDSALIMQEVTLLWHDYPDAHYLLGQIYARMGNRTSMAIESFSECLKLFPQHIGALLARGLCYMKRAEDERAYVDFKSVLELDPANGDAHLGLLELSISNVSGTAVSLSAAGIAYQDGILYITEDMLPDIIRKGDDTEYLN